MSQLQTMDMARGNYWRQHMSDYQLTMCGVFLCLELFL